jgi:hypothetical protein
MIWISIYRRLVILNNCAIIIRIHEQRWRLLVAHLKSLKLSIDIELGHRIVISLSPRAPIPQESRHFLTEFRPVITILSPILNIFDEA